ncbi:GAP family protein [Amorphoplanes digitatis]|uniref:Threonine/homoserine/homoserine lactone efflux protein n=1 Tax=Actinoplanes digitatis TaxID=1868 RepID=A0A7W7I255_9ACTN|nr:GAP family protein [Actinoplanes digitatis]MBB4764866.1 threonine/homoserine/homoserine lactone efflux protein [Actinoplanes digitatis]BFE74460.1 GAP family protein [Actinoplanes digitatis]GID91178.1 membrane protein [Actinoplanes digitatis]
MGAVLGDELGFAAGVMISPLPIIAMILILATPRGRMSGLVFAAGWLVGLSALGAITLVLSGGAGASGNGQPADWVGVLKLVIGLLLLLLGLQQWRHRPRDASQAELPKWMAAIDRFTPVKILGLSLVLSAANAKNAGLTIAAAAAISSSGIPTDQQIAVLTMFVLIGSLGILIPLVVFLIAGERARNTLSSWKNWAALHNAAIMTVLFVVLGMKLLGDGIGILIS